MHGNTQVQKRNGNISIQIFENLNYLNKNIVSAYFTREKAEKIARVDSMYNLLKISGVKLYRRRRIGVTSPIVTMLAHQRFG